MTEPKIIVFVVDIDTIATYRRRKAAKRGVVVWWAVAITAMLAFIAIVDRYLIIQ